MSTNKKLQELQNLAWRSLSGEFKEVVKNYYQYALKHYQISSLQRNVANTLEHFFGTDNLTSDAEGEEMLTVPRIQIQKLYSSIKKVNDPSSKDYINGVLNTLDALFGSKCLPDEGTDCTPVEPKPAEPFKVGDKVKVVNDDHHGNRYIGRVTEITFVDDSDDIYPYKTDLYDDLFGGLWYGSRHLKPYTEPKNKDSEFIRAESVKEARIADEETHLRNLSQETANCDKHSNNTLTDTRNAEIDHFVVKDEMVDNIIKDGFKNHNRLHIAAILAAGMLANDNRCYPVDRALELADALIAKSKERRTE